MNNSVSDRPEDSLSYIYSEVSRYVPECFSDWQYRPWVFSLLGSTIIGLSGVLPLLIIPVDSTANFQHGAASSVLKVLLSFAVGGLLGDVFLHLLPEAWSNETIAEDTNAHPSIRCGMWVLTGMLVFTIVEKIFAGYINNRQEETDARIKKLEKSVNCFMNNNEVKTSAVRRKNGKCLGGQGGKVCDIEVIGGMVRNGCCMVEEIKKESEKDKPRHVSGYLNLMANSVDNFTHGLAVGGSFLVSFRLGVLTTFAILVHEIPHEVGDFAILLRSGFSRWDAARAQLLTACAGMLGALTAIGGTNATTAIEARTCWIMPFTAGGFLHIALVTVLPDLLEEENPKESLKQLGALIVGIVIMASMSSFLE